MPEYPIAIQSYQSRSAPFSNQRCVNMYAENGVYGTKTQIILYNRPGLTTFSGLGSGPIRGIETMKQTPFVVSGEEVYTVDSTGAESLVGALAGTDNVSMANNGSQVAIVSNNNGFIASLARSGAITGAIDSSISATIDSVSDNGATQARFASASAHGAFVGQEVAHTTFADSNYNGTFTITAVPSTTTYDISAITFAGTGAGAMAGDSVSVQSSGQTLLDGESVTIADTTSYNGTFTIYNSLVNSFQINDTFVATETGTWATSASVVQITDDNFPSVSSVTFQSSFFVWSITNTGQFQLSPLNNGLGPYDALDRFTAEYNPDDLVAVFSDHDDLLLMGKDTIEPWYNSGDVDAPFVRNQGTVMEVGLLARDSVQKVDNSVIWLGNSGERGGVTVWRAAGYTPTRISTHALETEWERVSAANLALATAIPFRHEGHEFYVLTIPTSGTFVYDASTSLWYEWERRDKTTFDVVGFTDSFGLKIFGSATEGKLFTANVDVYTDDGELVIREGQAAVLASEDNNIMTHDFLRIDIETGVGLTTGQGSEPIISLQWADEDGISFNNLKERSLGKIGVRRKRVYWRRLGQARSRTYKFRTSDPVKTAILGAYTNVRPGRW